MKQKSIFVVLALWFTITALRADNIAGIVLDRGTHEPLIGATIVVKGSTHGTITDLDGHFTLNNTTQKDVTLLVSYVSYISQEITVKQGTDNTHIEVLLASDEQLLEEVTVTAQKNRESIAVLQMERRNAGIPIENIGAKEMDMKGIGNVQEGVKQITGVSIATAGQLIVRGLGDRYSTTTLNGLPIASPNPDNKLIPLDLFPAATVQSITVSKVYDASAFADYSGAHIDINTKDNITEDFLTVHASLGTNTLTTGRNFYEMNRGGTLFATHNLPQHLLDMSRSEFDNYTTTNPLFKTTFDVTHSKARPALGGNIGFGKLFAFAKSRLSILGSVSIGNELQTIHNGMVKNLEASGNVLNAFTYNSYTNTLKIAALGYVGYAFRTDDHIGYTFFYARNAANDFMLRRGRDYEDHQLIGLNDVKHVYRLMNHQLNGRHKIGSAFGIEWHGSYCATASDEPDRRQLMFVNNNDTLRLFKLNRQETMRYFGTLDESELVACILGSYHFGQQNTLKLGFDCKNKRRDYIGTRFYYNLNAINPIITNIDDIYHSSDFINQDNIASGQVGISRYKQPKDSYKAGSVIYAEFADIEYYPVNPLLLKFGIRIESSQQWVTYADDGGHQGYNTLKRTDVFPALNIKYQINQPNSLRFASSRTVTRPSFIEMAPFLYQESYGAAQIRGYEKLKNGYNYNFDLRFEHFAENGDLYAATAYFKHLNKPIERIQILAGGSTQHSFRNAEDGMAAGLEIEMRKQIVKDLHCNVNATYMYTNVKLVDGGAYTNAVRALQGASPFLANIDLTYTPKFSEESSLTLVLLYNLQGPRIHAVGIAGLGDIRERTLHTLNFNSVYLINKHFDISLKINNLLNCAEIFEQETNQGKTVEVERFKTGLNVEFGASYRL